MACVRTSSRACTQISDRHSRVLEEVLAGGGGSHFARQNHGHAGSCGLWGGLRCPGEELRGEPRHVGSGYGAASAGEFPFNSGRTSRLQLCWLGLLRVSSPRTAVSTAQGGPPFRAPEGWGAPAQTHCLAPVYQVLPDGTYVKLGVPKSNYFSMVVMRVDILLGEVLPLLQKACVIAIRYSVIRRQSRLRPRQEAPRGATTVGPPDPTVSAP